MAYTYTMNELKEEYRFVPRLRFPDGGNISLDWLKGALIEEANKNGIPLACEDAQLKIGGLFSKERESVLVFYHPEHKVDYLTFLIRVTYQGKYAFMDVYKASGSKNYSNNQKGESSAVRGIFNKMSGHAQKLQMEEDYYTILKDCFSNIITVVE